MSNLRVLNTEHNPALVKNTPTAVAARGALSMVPYFRARLARAQWSIESHSMLGPICEAILGTVLRCACRESNEERLPYLPAEIWMLVFAHLNGGDFLQFRYAKRTTVQQHRLKGGVARSRSGGGGSSRSGGGGGGGGKSRSNNRSSSSSSSSSGGSSASSARKKSAVGGNRNATAGSPRQQRRGGGGIGPL